MKTQITYVMAVGVFLMATQAAHADPMRCTGEEKNCNSNCVKFARATVSNCLEICRATRQICMRTGCWDNGTSKYCGLMKQ